MLAPNTMSALMIRRMFQIIMKEELEEQSRRLGGRPGPQQPLPGQKGEIRFLEWVRAFNIVIEKLFDEKLILRPIPGKPLVLTNYGRNGYESEKTGTWIKGEKDYTRQPELLKTERVREMFDDWAAQLAKKIEPLSEG